MNFETLKKHYNLCDPNEALDPDDPRNVDFDHLGSESERVRGRTWVDLIARKIELANHPVLELFSGFPGSGKSTELRRLLARLRQPTKANLLTVRVDAQELLDLTQEIDIPDLMFAVLTETERAVLDAEGKPTDQGLNEGYLKRLWDWLTDTDVNLKGLELGLPGGVGKLSLELKTQATLRARMRQAVQRSLSSFLQQAAEFLTLLNGRAKTLGRDGVVVVVDSLEKLRGTTGNWENVIASSEKMFIGGAPHLRLPVHVIYTVPPAVVIRSLGSVQFLPMVKIWENDAARTDSQPGLVAMRRLVTARVPDALLAQLLGQDFEARILEMIRLSGGYPRDLVRLLRGALAREEEEYPLSDVAFGHLLDDLRNDYRQHLTDEAMKWLAQVARTRQFRVEAESQREVADRMLGLHVVMRYCNGDVWADVHPAVRDLGELSALAGTK